MNLGLGCAKGGEDTFGNRAIRSGIGENAGANKGNIFQETNGPSNYIVEGVAMHKLAKHVSLNGD